VGAQNNSRTGSASDIMAPLAFQVVPVSFLWCRANLIEGL